MSEGKGSEDKSAVTAMVYVGFFSALDYWRGVSNLGDYHDNVELVGKDAQGVKHYRIDCDDRRSVEQPLFRLRDIKNLGITLSAEAPLDILVSKRQELRPSQRLRPHIVRGKLPARSFVRARDGVLVATPEATFVQLASVLTLPQLLLVGMELCGTYLLDGSGEDETGFAQRPRLITRKRLAQYVGWCKGCDGLDLARTAVRLLMDNSGSPRESVAVLALTIPKRHRGLGLPQPKLNHRRQVTRQNRAGTSQSQYYYDFYWIATKSMGKGHPKRVRRVDGEYDSDSNHAGTLKLNDDAHRGNSVQYMGTAHVVITNADIEDADKLITVARQISRCIWRRFPNQDALDALRPDFGDLLEELKSGEIYPVSLDKDGKVPLHHRPEA